MKKRIKIFLVSLFVILTLCLTFFLGLHIRVQIMESRLHPVTQPFSEMERQPICVDYAFDTGNLEKSIGFSDYTFIGTVEEILGTKYNKLYYRNFKLIDGQGPETYYKVKVYHNIKGSLPQEITLITYGGQNPDGTLKLVDPLPEDKTTCVFMCCESEGEYRLTGCNYLGGYDWSDTSSDVGGQIEKYETAYQNQDLSVRHD